LTPVLRLATDSVLISVIGLAALEATMTDGFTERTEPSPLPPLAEPSRMVSHAWHSPHCPTHLTVAQPHSVHA
jgi:hypothetical protein